MKEKSGEIRGSENRTTGNDDNLKMRDVPLRVKPEACFVR